MQLLLSGSVWLEGVAVLAGARPLHLFVAWVLGARTRVHAIHPSTPSPRLAQPRRAGPCLAGPGRAWVPRTRTSMSAGHPPSSLASPRPATPRRARPGLATPCRAMPRRALKVLRPFWTRHPDHAQATACGAAPPPCAVNPPNSTASARRAPRPATRATAAGRSASDQPDQDGHARCC